MFKEVVDRKSFWQWPAIVIAVLLFVALVQILRVNDRPHEASTVEPYVSSGPLIEDNIQIAAHEFYARRISLNRQTKLSGVFGTDSIKSHVSVLVMDEKNFNNWKADMYYEAVTQTGYVPGGKVEPVLQPGNYFLVIDNRRSEVPRSVRAEFILE